MLFLNRLIGTASQAPRTRPEDRSQRRRRAQFSLETLEGRELKTVANYYGQVLIQASQDYAETSIQKTENGTVEVVSDNESYVFDASEVTSITYVGSFGGGNTFINNTDYTTIVMTYTGNNNIQAGRGFNLLYLTGDNNNYHTDGYTSLVYTYGRNNNISGDNLYHIAY